jgi:hypothetical protein
VSLRIPSSSRSPDHDPHRTIYYLGYHLGRFAGLKHRQLARQVGVIITTGQTRRTLINKINLLVNSPRSIEASRLAPVKAESIFLRCASGCFGTSRGLSRDSSSTTSPRAGLSSTTSPTPRVRVPWHVARLVTRLVVDYFSHAARPGALARRTARRRLLRLCRASRCLGMSRSSSRGSSSTTSPTPRVRVPRHVARLVTRLVVDYFTYAARPFASARHVTCCVTHRRLLHIAQARHVARRATRRRLLRIAQARRRLLLLRSASRCLGSSRGSSLTTWTTQRVRVPRHVAWLILPLVVDYFTSAARPGA